jgi:DNA-binding NarL/FixJ family response regulator
MRKIRVVIAEDHDIVRQGLKILVCADPGLEVAGEAADGHKAVEVAERERADVIVMDLAMPRANGLEATRRIIKKHPQSKILVLSSYGDPETVQTMLEAGAMGYITKHSASDDLLEGIREVNSGRRYLSPRLAAEYKRRQRHAFLNGASERKVSTLSPRESEVLTLIGEGLSTKQVATRLTISVKTVEKHRQALMDKLEIHEVAGLTRYAADKGLLGVKARVPVL